MSAALCIDASVAAKWLIPEADSDRAEALLTDALRQGIQLVAPPHLDVEVTSALYKRVRAKEVTADEAKARLGDYALIPMELLSPTGLAERAMEIALGFDWALPYDAFYLGLGELLGCEVWTADAALYKDAHGSYAELHLLSEYELSFHS